MYYIKMKENNNNDIKDWERINNKIEHDNEEWVNENLMTKLSSLHGPESYQQALPYFPFSYEQGLSKTQKTTQITKAEEIISFDE